MKWQDAIRDWFASRKDCEERAFSSDDRFGTTEVLECRLVLGALSGDTSALTGSTATATTSTDSMAGDSGSETSTTSSSSAGATTASTTLASQPASTVSSTNSTSSTSPDDSPATSTPQPSSQSGTSSATLPTIDSTTAVINSTTVLPAAAPAVVTSTPSTTNSNVLATSSAPLANVAGTTPSTVQSPPAAIDNALTAVNRNVMVSSDVISGAGTVNAAAAAVSTAGTDAIVPAWFGSSSTVSTIHYDFRDQNGVTNQITTDQMAAVEQVLSSWSQASGGKVQFVRDTQAAAGDIVNIGVGDLSAVSSATETGTTLGTSVHSLVTVDGNQTSVGTIWLNGTQNWSNAASTNPSSSSYDFDTVMAHEVGHIVGIEDDASQAGIMNPTYSGAQDLSGIAAAWASPTFYMSDSQDVNGFITDNMADPQLTADEVTKLLQRASAAIPGVDNAIIAVVDRNGNILGVRVEQGVLNTIKDSATLAFAIDGAISEARTAAFFSNNATAVTSRTVEGLSQSTILQREVEANPNSMSSTTQGPGFVAPIGVGGHFPAGINDTPPVDLFNIEASNRDSTVVAGTDRFNINPANVPAGQAMTTPISWGTEAGIAGDSQNRGIGTLPGGIPIYRDPNHNGVGATLIGGIGVFFPGADGYATHEQGFVAGQGQTEFQRMNTTQELEAEFMGIAAVGGSPEAAKLIGTKAIVGTIGGVPALTDVDLLFESITLKGILLPVAGTTPGAKGLGDLINQFGPGLINGTVNGTDQTLSNGMTSRAGMAAPSGWLVTPHVSPDNSSTLTTAEMTDIINAGIAAANRVRATLRVQPNGDTGQQDVRMTFAISDKSGNILAMYRMDDGTVFSEDVAVAKARNVAYFNNPDPTTGLQPQDQVHITTGQQPVVSPGTSFTNRTFRFLAEPRFPAGIDGSGPPQFSILNDAAAAHIDPVTGENIAGYTPAPSSDFTSVMGNDVFHVGTNFHDTPSANQNGIIFFPGSTSLYKNGQMVGGLGVSGDGVNQDDTVTFLAAQGYLPDDKSTPNALPVDNATVDGVRLPYINFTRNPFG